jgi:hypothetical protein
MSLNFMKILKVQNVLESNFCKLYIVSYAQVQHSSNSWLKLSSSKESQKLQNILWGHPFL